MTLFNRLPLYRTINEYYEAVGFRQHTTTNDFYTFRIEDTFPDVPRLIPPYRKTFYHLALVHNLQGVGFNLNSQQHRPDQTILLAHSPEHIHSVLRPLHMRGVVVNFTDAFVINSGGAVCEEFPFFSATNRNVIPLDDAQTTYLLADFERVYAEYHGTDPYRIGATQGYLLALLYHAKQLFLTHEDQSTDAPGNRIVRQFRRLVETHYLTKRSIGQYADLIGTSPGHLSDTLKDATGCTPKSFIDARLLLEVQNMLIYSELSVAQIAYQTGFSEPGNLTRFFKKHCGLSPHAYRRQMRELSNPGG
ncbi:MAG: helix-turn-helix transcriptional regulator [Ferruginibacter sp.]|nr:helix-turn-helix transcriptional regulator [Cytophagales bacterium]